MGCKVYITEEEYDALGQVIDQYGEDMDGANEEAYTNMSNTRAYALNVIKKYRKSKHLYNGRKIVRKVLQDIKKEKL